MPFRSPLTDCTNAALQAMNCITSTPGLIKKAAMTTYTHKPYIPGLIDPSECSSADEYEMIYSSSYSNFSTPQRTWFTEPNSPAVRSPYNHLFNSFSVSPGLAERSLFRSHSKIQDEESGNFIFSHSPVTLRQLTSSPQASTARCVSAEVKVQLRSCDDEFFIKDITKLFGSDDVSSLLNSYVVVEGDRGEDMGCIVEVLCSRMGVSAAEIAASNLKKVLRPSSPEDLTKFANLDKEEKEAVEVCCKSIRKVGLNANICIEGAVFQFDKKKLTIQYTADGYVDFTQLTRILHNCYKCRIWMDQLNRSTALHDKKSRQKSQVVNNKRRPAPRKTSHLKQ